MDKENSPLTTSRGRRVNVVQADRAVGKGDAKAAASKAPKAEKAKPAEKVSKELKTKAPPAPKAAAEKVAKKDVPAATPKAPAPCPLCGSLTPFCAMTGKAHSVPKAPKVSKQALPAAAAAVSIVDDDDEDAAISSLLVQPAPVPAVGIKRARSAKPTAANGQTPTTQKRRTEGKTSAAAPAVVSSDDEDTPLIALASVEVLEPPPSSTGPKKRGTTQTTLNFKKSGDAGVIPPPPVKPFKPVFNKISSTLARSIFLDALDTKGKASDGGGKTADEGEADVDGEANESSMTGAAAISSAAAAATKVDKVRTSRAYLSFVFDFMSERSKYEIVRAEMNKNGGSLPDKYAKRVRAAPAATHAPKGPVKGGGVSIATMLNKQGSSGSIAGDNKAASPVKQGSNPSPIKKQVSTTKNASPAKNPDEEGSVPMVVGDGNGAGAVTATTPKKAGGKRSRSATSASPTNQK